MICRACGNDEFEYDGAVGDLTDASDEVELKCTHCGSATTKDELIEDNFESSLLLLAGFPKTSWQPFRKASMRLSRKLFADGFRDLNEATAVGDLIALAALVTSIVSIRKSNKAESLWAKIAVLDAKLKVCELADAEYGRNAFVKACAISAGKGRRLRICNVGMEPAREVDFEVLDKNTAGLVMKD